MAIKQVAVQGNERREIAICGKPGLKLRFVAVLVFLGFVLVVALGYLIANTGGRMPKVASERGDVPIAQPLQNAAPGQGNAVITGETPSPSHSQGVQGRQPGVFNLTAPDVSSLVILIRTTILALDQANRTGDYSILLSMGAPGLRRGVSPEAFARVFTGLRQSAVSLSTVAVTNPILDQKPILGMENGRPTMRLAGTFPGVSELIAFDIIFEQWDDRWLVFGLGVKPTGKPSTLPPEDGPIVDGKPAMPTPYIMTAMIRDAVIALDQANRTGDYDVLAKLSAPGFREANSPKRLSELFGALRRRDIDLSPVTVIDPGLYAAPAIMDNGMLRIMGFFPSKPERVNFDLAYQYVEGDWKLFGIGVNTSREFATDDRGVPESVHYAEE